MDYPEFAEPDGSLLVSVRCLGLGISSKSPLPTAGLFSNLYVSMTKNPNVKNEKKYVKIEQSEHFPNHLKIQQQTQASAAASIKYKTIYTSEIFEEITDVFPSLLAKIRTVPGYDSKLKLIVYYSSSLTSGKEVSLAYQSFYESDLIRSVQQSSVFIVPLESEYCIASKAYVDIIQPLPSLLENSIFPVTALPSEKNPLTQNYVFYNELDTITPYLDAKEQCWEPKFVASIPLVFLSNLQQSLERSIAAWEKRLELERMRQGRFTSDAEALACGWNIIDISIKAARIGSTKSTIDRLNYIRQSNGGNPASVTAAASNPASTSDTPNIYVSQYPLSEDYPDIPTTSTNTASFSVPPASPSAPPRQDSGVVRHDSGVAGRPARRTGTGGFKFLGSSGGRGKVVTCDESLPSTFVEVYIEDLSKTFVDIVGRTNTEYHTMYPVYGSNLHANIVRKANTTAVAANEVVHLVHEEKEYPFHVFECSNKQFIPRRWRFANSHYSEANDVAEEPQHSFSSVNGKSTHFRKYISNCDHTYVRLDFCFETPAGKKKCVGTVAVPVTVKPGEKVRSWVPVRSFTHTLEEQYAIYDNIDILVEIDVTLSSTDLLQSINDRHVDVYAYNRSVTGDVTLPLPKGQNAPVPFEQHRQVIADCYEWMWQLGFTGHDPYILETSNSNNNSLTHPTDTTAFNTSSNNNNNNNNNNTSHTTSTRKEGGGRGSVIGGAGSGWSLSEDEKDVNDVITLPKTFSASDLMNSDPTTANPTTNTTSSGNPAATSSPPVNRRRSSRVQYINKAALPDSDDEAFDDDVTNAPAHGLIRGRSAASFETRKSLFEDDVDTAELIRTSEGENTVVDKFNALLIDLDEGVQGVSSNNVHVTGTPNKIAAATSEVLQSLPQPPPQPLPAGSLKVTSVRSRVDFVLRLDWITHHVSELKKLLDEIRQSYLPDLRKKIRSEKAFRSSVLKKDTVVQPLPTNLHYQLLGIRKHCVACIDAHPKNTEIIHSLTCGALSPHLLGHKTGGLFHQESLLVQEKDKLFSLKESYLKKIKHFGDNGIRTDSEHSPYHILTELGRVVEGYEAMCVSVGRRRLLAISQALTVAINALTLKLNLVIEEQIPYQIANRWVETGFLVVFEGLLSVIGNERSMLEDTISAIDALTSYQVKILPNTTTSEAFHSGPPPPPPPSSPMPYDRSTSTSSTSEVHGHSMSGVRGGTAQRPNDHIVDIDFDMKGREIQLYISEAAISRLSEEYQRLIRRQELVLKFYPVLFTQGIDIQQTMVTTFGGDSTSKKRSMTSVDLQNYVNRVAFNRLNAYCFRTQPIAGVRHTLTDIDQKKEISATEYYASNPPSAPQTPAGKDNRMSGRFTSPAASAKHTDIPIPMTSDRSPRASSHLAQSPATSSFMTAARPKSTDSEGAATSLPEIHPLAQSLYDSIRHSTLTMKNVDLLIEVERLSLILGGIRITFCKSGKDRTGMAVTLEQARQLGERFSCGMASERLLKDANLMRVHGCRLMVAEKNIGKPVYSINILQAQFLPEMFRPPAQVCEDILKKDNS